MYELGELAPGNQLNPSWVISIRSHIKYIRKVDTHCHCYVLSSIDHKRVYIVMVTNN